MVCWQDWHSECVIVLVCYGRKLLLLILPGRMLILLTDRDGSYILLLLDVDILAWNVCCLCRRGDTLVWNVCCCLHRRREDCFRCVSGGDIACCCCLLHDASIIHAASSLSQGGCWHLTWIHGEGKIICPLNVLYNRSDDLLLIRWSSFLAAGYRRLLLLQEKRRYFAAEDVLLMLLMLRHRRITAAAALRCLTFV